ncbi:hypothetical protein [Streptomyces sioyaensis]
MRPRLRSYKLLPCHSASFIDAQSIHEAKTTPPPTHPSAARLGW